MDGSTFYSHLAHDVCTLRYRHLLETCRRLYTLQWCMMQVLCGGCSAYQTDEEPEADSRSIKINTEEHRSQKLA